MLRWLAALVLGLVALPGFAKEQPPTVHPNSTKWDDLFAEDLSNANNPDNSWYFNDRILTPTVDKVLWTKQPYADFILDLEFKNEEGTNSGVFVYCADMKNFVNNSIEVQIADDFFKKWAESPRSWQCGAIFGRQAPNASVVNKPGEWNRMTITCDGPVIYVILNGRNINRMDMRKFTMPKKNPDGTEVPKWLVGKPLSKYQTKGYIGLQGKHADAPVYFRSLKIKPL